MEWRQPDGSVCLLLLISPCTIKSRSSLLAPAHLGGPGKRAVKRLWWCGVVNGNVLPPVHPMLHPSSTVTVSIFLLLVTVNNHHTTTTTILWPPAWAGAKRKLLLDFMVLGRITRGRHTNSLGGCHSIWTNQQSTSNNPHFYAECPSCCNPPNLSWLGRHKNMLDCVPGGLVCITLWLGCITVNNPTIKCDKETSHSSNP